MLHQIGAGTLGPVFRAYDSTRERLVAVKLFKLDLPPERGHQLVAEFERLLAADLKHPGLASPLAAGISDVSAFLVQEYVAADSLDLAIRGQGAAPAANVLRVAAQLAGALDYAAALDVIHGALHPRDVLLSSDNARLTGLGVTRALARIGVVAPVRRPYTAPERLAGGEWDRRADVFSLAALMHELMWGRRVSGVGAQAADSLTGIAGADLSALRATFARALADDPAERYETALEFAQALRHACPDVVVAPAPAPAPKRRAVREDAPRLPLDEDVEVAQATDVAQDEEAVQTEEAAPAEKVVRTEEAVPAQEVVPAEDVVSAEAIVQALRPVVDAELGRNVAQGEKVAQGFQPPLAVDPGELRRGTPKRDVREGGSPADLPMAAPYEPPMAIPAGLMLGHDPEPLSALDRTRSAIWPIVLALVVGIAIGFAGGYGVGSREQPGTAAVTAAAPAPVPAGREFTEGAVAAAPATPAPAASPKPDVGTSKAKSGNQQSETRNLKSPARASKSSGAPAGRPTGGLAVNSRPAGARVYMDGKLVGTTPVSLAAVPAASHAIRLEHDGYRRWSSSVRVVAGEQHRVTASLER